jgi:hypothetical protein
MESTSTSATKMRNKDCYLGSPFPLTLPEVLSEVSQAKDNFTRTHYVEIKSITFFVIVPILIFHQDFKNSKGNSTKDITFESIQVTGISYL